MQPVHTVLFLIGYGLALPIGSKFSVIRASQNRVAMFGHQIGVFTAGLAWGLRGSIVMIGFHAVWLVAARIWFGLGKRSDGPGL